MRKKLHYLGRFTLIVLMGVSLNLPSALAAELNNKSADANTTSQPHTSNLQTPPVESIASVKQAEWEQEPTSFMAIELGQPLSKSVSTACPNTDSAYVMVEAIKDGKRCYAKNPGLDFYSIWGISVPPLKRRGYVTTLDGRLDGAVGNFQINFNSSDFSQVMEMFVIKYGPPHKNIVKKLKTKGGAEFDNIVLSWIGKNVYITVESLAYRGFDGGSLDELGVIDVNTSEYLAKKSNSSSEAAQKSAAGL